jgi:DNA-binding CsgD family transcriptional regulator
MMRSIPADFARPARSHPDARSLDLLPCARFKLDDRTFVVYRLPPQNPDTSAERDYWRCIEQQGLTVLLVDGSRHAILLDDAKILSEFKPVGGEWGIRLTPRELEIVGLVASGDSNKAAASLLGISKWTVAAHVRRLFAKLGVASRAELVFRCSRLVRREANRDGDL